MNTKHKLTLDITDAGGRVLFSAESDVDLDPFVALLETIGKGDLSDQIEALAEAEHGIDLNKITEGMNLTGADAQEADDNDASDDGNDDPHDLLNQIRKGPTTEDLDNAPVGEEGA
jgi:hypothetical protein